MSNIKTELKGEPGLSKEAIEEAKASLAKLPILGPVIWLYGRDPGRRYTFVGDLDWLVLPPVVLDQCKIYFKAGIPLGYVSWAKVSDLVDERLRSGVGKIAPHEWRSGNHVWLIEVLAPFGSADELVDEVSRTVFPGTKVNRLVQTPDGKAAAYELPASGATPDAIKH